MQALSRSAFSRAFTLVEVMLVVLIVGVLAAVVVPRFTGVTEDAKAGALQANLGGVRAAIAGFRTKQIIAGANPYPTLTQLNTLGTVLQSPMPVNPYNNKATVQSVTAAQAAARTVLNTTTIGWNYYIDNAASPPAAIFYANTSTTTTVSNPSGGYFTANQL